MNNLIDHFTPGELLHIVSIANQHGFLKTENKRFLIALRMSSPWEDGSWQVDDEKKSRFVPILGQFLQELEPWQRCNKDECVHCDRFQSLHKDFHGAQESTEFKLFMDWFMNGSRTYGVASTTTKEQGAPAPLAPLAKSVPVAPALAPKVPEVPVVPEEKIAPSAAIQKPLAEQEKHPVKELQRSWDSAQPLFTLNKSHPAVRSLENLARQDLHLMDDYQLRDFTARFQKMAREFLASMTSLQDEEEDSEPEPGKAGLRRIV